MPMAHQPVNTTPGPPDMVRLAALYQQYAPALFAHLARRLPSQEDAEDILVEIFLAALESEQFSALSEKAQLAWLWRVTHNKMVDVYRRVTRRRGRNVDLDVVAEQAMDDDRHDPESTALLHEEYNVLREHLKTLTPLQQEVLRLRFGQDMRCAEIANHLGKHEGAVKVMLSRTLNMLRKLYHT